MPTSEGTPFKELPIDEPFTNGSSIDDGSITLAASEPSPLTILAPSLSPHILRRKGLKTVTETTSITVSVFDISVTIESQTFIQTNTVYINKTVIQPVTYTAHITHLFTISHTVPTTVFATTTLLSSPTTAKAKLSPVPAHQEGKLSGVAVAGVVLGSLAGAGLLLGLAWVAMTKYRGWKAKKNQHMKGVELQRRWEREQERKMEEMETSA